MKKFILLLLVAATFAACENAPDNRIHAQRENQVLLKPTWGQAQAFAAETEGRGLMVALAILALIIFIVALIARVSDASWLPQGLAWATGNFMLLIYLAAFIVLLFGKSMSIKWNNDKWVPKAQYDRYSGDTKPIWDSLRAGCHIVDGPSDCFKRN